MPGSVLAQDSRHLDRAWEIGPLIRGRNYSLNMPLHPSISDDGWTFDFPGPRARDGHVHYVTRESGPLDEARGIRVRYRVTAERGTRFVPQEMPHEEATLSLYFQTYNDDWSARGRHEFARWYSPSLRQFVIEPGEHEITVMFDENWRSVMGSDQVRSPGQFADALANVGRVGLTFGSRSRRGHGVFATGRASFELLAFDILS